MQIAERSSREPLWGGSRQCSTNVSEAEYTCYGLGLEDQGRLLGRGRGGGQIIGATYILLNELCINQAGSGDQLVRIKVNQLVAGLLQGEGRGGRAQAEQTELWLRAVTGAPGLFPAHLEQCLKCQH